MFLLLAIFPKNYFPHTPVQLTDVTGKWRRLWTEIDSQTKTVAAFQKYWHNTIFNLDEYPFSVWTNTRRNTLLLVEISMEYHHLSMCSRGLISIRGAVRRAIKKLFFFRRKSKRARLPISIWMPKFVLLRIFLDWPRPPPPSPKVMPPLMDSACPCWRQKYI